VRNSDNAQHVAVLSSIYGYLVGFEESTAPTNPDFNDLLLLVNLTGMNPVDNFLINFLK